MMRTSWRRLLIYAEQIETLDLEDTLRWLGRLHTAEPQKDVVRLRQKLTRRHGRTAQAADPLLAAQMDPLLAGAIQEVDQL